MTDEPFDRFDDAKRALEDVPANDVWAEAQRRAADGTVVSLAPVVEPRRRPAGWIAGAAAAAVLLLIGAVAARSGDDDPVTSGGDATTEDVCGFTSAPIVTDGPSELLTERVGSPPPSVVHGVHPSQSGRDYPFEVSSPADDGIVIGPEDAGDDAGDAIVTRTLTIERGDASVVADGTVSQLTWSPAGAAPCETFSVTVAGPPGEEMDGVLTSVADAITLTGPEGTADAPLTTYQADGGCKLGITGEPLPEPVVVSPVEPVVGDAVGTLVDGSLNPTQAFELQVPGQVATDLVGERVEDVQLRRGTAQLWFMQTGAVQVRWFTGSEEPCESFTVTVDGGTEDENRHAAVDLAERVVLGTELPECCEPTPPTSADPLDGTEWQLERATVDGEPTQGSGALFSFADGRVTWTDLCNTFDGDYAIAEGALRVGATTEVTSTAVDCEANPTTDAIHALMGAGRIGWTIDDGGFLVLDANGVVLVLRPPVGAEDPGSDDDPGPFDTSALIGTRWVVTALEEDGQTVALPAQSVPVEFVDGAIIWRASCNSASTPVSYGIGTITVTGPTGQTLARCEEDTAGDELIRAVITSQADDPNAPPRGVQRVGGTLRLEVADKVVTLSPA